MDFERFDRQLFECRLQRHSPIDRFLPLILIKIFNNRKSLIKEKEKLNKNL
jgi:hypothetical protein